MARRTKPTELSSAGLRRVLRDASARVVKENLNVGVSMTVVENGRIVEINPDNSRRVLGKVASAPVRLSQTEFRIG